MKCTLDLAVLLSLGLLFAVPVQAADTIAITEFMSQPIGEEQDGREWVELYNYGNEPVNIRGWTLSDEGNDSVTLPDVNVPPGDFVVIVAGLSRGRDDDDRKGIFETEWLGGKSDPRVIGVSGRFSLSDSADQIHLRNRARQPIWGLAYRGDGTPGRATFFYDDKFGLKIYGTKANPGVNRNGNDFRYSILGYEGNNHTEDPEAYESDVSQLEAKYGPLYQSAENGGTAKPGFGSPLKGHYSGVKK
jgi:hypothetical protein